jgi:3-oxoacyl-[acyl-carrier protein] reductase
MNATSPVVLLTGAASGIGRNLAGAFMSLGYQVMATDIDFARLQSVATADRWPAAGRRLRVLDVRDSSAWETALAELVDVWGGVDLLFNVAGCLKPGRTVHLTAADVDFHVDVNLKGVIHGTRIVGAHMAQRRRGHIVTVGSLASLAPVGGLTLYVASKFAVRGFCLAAAQDLRPYGVAVSVLMPDAVQTPMLELQVDSEDAAVTFSGAAPLTVDEVTRVVLEHVLPDRPLECAWPRSRGLLARLANLAPGIIQKLTPWFEKKGKANQHQAKLARRG